MVYGYQAGYRPTTPGPAPEPPRAQPRQVPYIPPAASPQRYGASPGGKGNGPGGGGNGLPPGGQPPRPPQQPKPKKKHRLLTFVLLLLLLLAVAAATYGYVVYQDVMIPDNVFYEGVYVAGLDVGGKTKEEAALELSSLEAQKLSQWYVTLYFGEKAQSIAASDIDVQLVLQDQLDAALQVGRTGNLFQRQRVIRALREEPYQTSAGITYSQARLSAILGDVKLGLDRVSTDADYTFDPMNEQPFEFTPEVDGRSLDIEPIEALIDACLNRLESANINLEDYLTVTPPAVTVAKLQDETRHIVTVSTQINSSSTKERNENIRVALEAFNGLRVVAGERVSFNKVAGKRTEQNGYMPALEIVSGEYVMGIGGGVCQVSTTLYQAVLRSGLEVVDRAPHAIQPNYTEAGQDATVADDRTDFVFRNNTELPVYITGRLVESSDGRTRRCEISIYGKPFSTDYTYALETQQLEEIPIPEPTYVPDRKQEYVTYTGEEEQVSSGRTGLRVAVYRLKMQGTMVVDREYLHEDYYKEKAPVIYFGTRTRE